MSRRTDGSVDVLERIYFLSWSACPDANEVHRALEGIVAARRSAGRPLVLLSIVPSNARIPGRDGREALLRITPIVDRLCEAQYAVFQGASIGARIVRAFLVAVGLAMQTTVEIVPDVKTALQRAGTRLGIDPETLIAVARERGTID